MIPAALYLEHFASDRSHMLDASSLSDPPVYNRPPPDYPCIVSRSTALASVSHEHTASSQTSSTLSHVAQTTYMEWSVHHAEGIHIPLSI